MIDSAVVVMLDLLHLRAELLKGNADEGCPAHGQREDGRAYLSTYQHIRIAEDGLQRSRCNGDVVATGIGTCHVEDGQRQAQIAH